MVRHPTVTHTPVRGYDNFFDVQPCHHDDNQQAAFWSPACHGCNHAAQFSRLRAHYPCVSEKPSLLECLHLTPRWCSLHSVSLFCLRTHKPTHLPPSWTRHRLSLQNLSLLHTDRLPVPPMREFTRDHLLSPGTETPHVDYWGSPQKQQQHASGSCS